jgi:phosphoribosylglycinamide formyltransferase-1
MTPRHYESESEYSEALMSTLLENGVELIVLAGYMRKIPAAVIDEYRGRILNIHPALLPDFGGSGMYGDRVHEAVVAAGRAESGATVHYVDGEYDTGEIIAQRRVPVLSDDTPESLAERVIQAEHYLYPRVVVAEARKIAEESERFHRDA